MMKTLSIPAGAAVLLGAPAKPMSPMLSTAVGEMVRSITGIREAYLPQCFVNEVMQAPAQVLVVVFDDAADRQTGLNAIGNGLKRVLPEGMYLDVWPMNDGDNLLSTVRGTRTHIHCPPPPLPKKPWWSLFR